MQTDDLIAMMTAGHRSVDTGWLRRASWLCALAALALTALLVLLALGPRPDLASAWLTRPVIAKVLLGASVASIALVLFQRSLRPGLKPGKYLPLVAIPVALVVAWALTTLSQAPAEQWSALVFGRHWRACLVAVPLYALLPLVILLGLARRGAPVDGRLTGVCAGLASAGLATVAYSLHCPDDTAPFLATWYTIAIAIVAAFGALAVPRFLRW
ncbi:NrsF family protein [Bosea sp. NPDC003192]|uniref:NrsF family protein n=1 Tax=Bosea sp. NPDC003192 TaxID=3390551 RepID=UPI003D02B671